MMKNISAAEPVEPGRKNPKHITVITATKNAASGIYDVKTAGDTSTRQASHRRSSVRRNVRTAGTHRCGISRTVIKMKKEK